MPAVSQAQQSFMGMVKAYQEGKLKKASAKVKKAARSMSHKSASDFARTERKGLPKKVKESYGHSVPVEELVAELKRLVDQHERAVLNGRSGRVLDDLEQGIEQLQAAIEQRQREIQTEAIKTISFKQYLAEEKYMCHVGHLHNSQFGATNCATCKRQQRRRMEKLTARTNPTKAVREAISLKDIPADKRKGAERLIAQQHPTLAAPDPNAALKAQALETATKAYRFVTQLGPEGEQMLMRIFKTMGPEGEAGAKLYNQVKAKYAQATAPAAQPAAAQPAVAQTAQRQAQLARAAAPMTAGFDFNVDGKDLLEEAVGAYLGGMAKAAAGMAAQKVGQYGAGAQSVWDRIKQAGKEARAEAQVKQQGPAKQPTVTARPQQAQRKTVPIATAEQKLQAVAQQLAQLATALTKAGAFAQKGAQ